MLCCVSRLVMCARGKHKQSDVASSYERNRRAFSKGLLIARRADEEGEPPDNRSMSIIRRDKQSAIEDGKGIVEEDLLDAGGAGSVQKSRLLHVSSFVLHRQSPQQEYYISDRRCILSVGKVHSIHFGPPPVMTCTCTRLTYAAAAA